MSGGPGTPGPGTPGEPRADYGRAEVPGLGAWVERVEEGSPAWEAGLEPGMRVDAVNGAALSDLIAWRWEADGASCELEVFDPRDGQTYACELVREPGQDWGVEFTDVLFDGVRTCVNACRFCFMAMLPADARASLMLRDDDYRLSFLQGNFVTLTNVSDEDVERIVTQRLEPMNVSLHAVSPEVRRTLIGPRAARGIEALERLLAAGIEVHGQVVLCPGVNDGDELTRTLDWVEARPKITSLALVPLGYTKFSRNFSRSYSDDPAAAREVVRLVEPYQERSRAAGRGTRFQLSDEFYVDANLPVPPADDYDGYPQFYDGIGMLRSFLDETGEVLAVGARYEGERDVLLVCGEAAKTTIDVLCRGLSPAGRVRTFAVRNDYYGGDVNVTGLIVERDLLAQLPRDLAGTLVVLPEVMFNFDKMTLDGGSLAHIEEELRARGAEVRVATTTPRRIAAALSQPQDEED